MNAEHVIFGAGAIGLATAAVLHERGETVRMVNRSGHAPTPDGVEVVGGNAADPAFTTAVAAGARVVYQTLNPPYHRWPEEFPPLQAGVLAATRASGPRMVSMDNVYTANRDVLSAPRASHRGQGAPQAPSDCSAQTSRTHPRSQ